MSAPRLGQAFLLLLVAGITVGFFAMLRPFLMTILLAAIFTAVLYPWYAQLLVRVGGRRPLAAIIVLVLAIVLVVAPLFIVLGAATNEALRVSESVRPAVERLIAQPSIFDDYLRALPGYEMIEPYRDQVLLRAGEVIGGLGTYLFEILSATTRATLVFLFHFAVLLYTMFFFFISGPTFLNAILSRLPLAETDKQRVLGRFVSVTRATLKGNVLVGLVQGSLSGLAFWVLGIEGAIFWGAVMTVLSIIPGIGGAFVWVPTAIVLAVQGQLWQALALVLFGSLIVGSVDNLLRPRLVGRDTQMHDLMIFFSTLGGIMLFGVMGFIVGPILAALFITAWDMFATAFVSQHTSPSGIEIP
jgi:predicted PurR-regulated permease PerM